MDKIIISFNGQHLDEIEKMNGLVISVNWAALLPTISHAIRLRDDEVIEGLVVNDTDIRVKLSRKKGRKTKSESSLKDAGV